MLKKLLIILLSLVLSSCASVQSSNGKNYERLYKDCVKDYNSVVIQDNECADELSKCLQASKMNQDVVDILKRNQKKDRMKWFGLGFGVGTIVITGIAIGAIFGRK